MPGLTWTESSGTQFTIDGDKLEAVVVGAAVDADAKRLAPKYLHQARLLCTGGSHWWTIEIKPSAARNLVAGEADTTVDWVKVVDESTATNELWVYQREVLGPIDAVRVTTGHSATPTFTWDTTDAVPQIKAAS